ALERRSDAEHAERNVELGEDAQHAPDPNTRAVLKGRFHERIPFARHWRKADVIEHPLRRCVAVEDVRLTPRLIVEVEVERDTGASRPLRVGGMVTVAHVIASPLVWGTLRHRAPLFPCTGGSVTCRVQLAPGEMRGALFEKGPYAFLMILSLP